MKQYIVTAALLFIIMFFPLQNMVDDLNNTRKVAMNNIIHQYAQKARTNGSFTNDMVNDMENIISKVFYIDKSEIEIDVTLETKYRLNQFNDREMIDYTVSVPIKRLIAMHKFWGMTDQENQMNYILKGSIASELLEPVGM